MESILKRCSALTLKNQIKTMLNKNTTPKYIKNIQQQKHKQSQSTRSPPIKQIEDKLHLYIDVTTFETQKKNIRQQHTILQIPNQNQIIQKDIYARPVSALPTKNQRNSFQLYENSKLNDKGYHQLKILRDKKRLKIIKNKCSCQEMKENKQTALYYQQNNKIMINLNNLGGNIIKISSLNGPQNKEYKSKNEQKKSKVKVFRGDSFSSSEQIKQNNKLQNEEQQLFFTKIFQNRK